MELPKTSRFILTDQTGRRSYCVYIIFTEEVSHDVYCNLTPAYIPLQNDIKYYEKAICLVSSFPFYENYKKFLSEIYRMQVSSSVSTYLEKHISYFIESILIDKENYNNAIIYEIGSFQLKFFYQPIFFQDCDFIKDSTYLPLVSSLPLLSLLEVFKTVLTEGKIIFMSKSINLLGNIITSINNLIFPFKWPHVLITLLPYKMNQFIDAPVPYIIGIDYDININSISEDILFINLDEKINQIIKRPKEEIPELPKAISEKMLKKLKKIYNENFDEEHSFYINEFDSVYANPEILDNEEKFKSIELKDAFLEFFICLFKNYKDYLKPKVNGAIENSTNIFNIESFLKDFNANEGCFLKKFTDTSLFNIFIDENFQSTSKNTPVMEFLIERIKNGKGKDKFLFPHIDPTPTKIVDPVERFLDSPKYSSSSNNSRNESHIINNLSQLLKNNKISYSLFPKLDSSKFIHSSRSRKAFYSPKFIIQNDEWCHDVNDLSPKENVKYLLLMVYELWIELAILFLSQSSTSFFNEVINFIIFLLNELLKSKKIQPSRNLFYKIIKFLASYGQINKEIDVSSKVNLILSLLPSNQQAKGYYALLDGYMKTKNDYPIKKYNTDVTIATKLTTLKANDKQNSMKGVRATIKKFSLKKLSFMKLDSVKEEEDNINIKLLLNGCAFICYNFCPKCININISYNIMRYEDILCSFYKSKTLSICICKTCNYSIYPKLYLIHLYESKINYVDSVNLLYINHLLKEVELKFRLKGQEDFISNLSIYFKDNKTIFWNFVFYFKYFCLPTFILDRETYLNSLELEISESKSSIQEKTKNITSKYFTSIGNISTEFTFFKNKNNNCTLDSFVKTNYNINESSLNVLSPIKKSSSTTFLDWEKVIHRKIIELTKENGEYELNSNYKIDTSQLSDFKSFFAPFLKDFYSSNEKNLEKIYARFDGSKELIKLIEDLNK